MGFNSNTQTISTEFIAKVVACHYSLKVAYVLIGAVDKDKNLIICAEAVYTNQTISAIAKLLIDYHLPVWVNRTHKSLNERLGECFAGELDFRLEQETEPLDILYSDLIAEGRLKAPGLNLPQEVEPCLKILVKALEDDLDQTEVDFEFSVGEPREIYRIWAGY